MRFATQTSGKAKITWQQTSTNTAAGLTAANIIGAALQNAVGALITSETYDIRYTLDGTTPTTSTGDGADFGHIMYAGAGIILDDPGQIQNFQFVSKTADSHGVLHITSFFAKL